jgi:hypothetical protein
MQCLEDRSVKDVAGFSLKEMNQKLPIFNSSPIFANVAEMNQSFEKHFSYEPVSVCLSLCLLCLGYPENFALPTFFSGHSRFLGHLTVA